MVRAYGVFCSLFIGLIDPSFPRDSKHFVSIYTLTFNIDLNVIPKLSPEEVFDFADNSYEGPELPAKYQDLILRNDWFLPGKAIKKKRRHRASHGKIR